MTPQCNTKFQAAVQGVTQVLQNGTQGKIWRRFLQTRECTHDGNPRFEQRIHLAAEQDQFRRPDFVTSAGKPR